MQQNEVRARGIDMTELDARPAAAANFVSLLFISQNGGNVCLRKTSPFFLVWLWHRRHTDRIDLRRRPRSVGILRVRGLPLLRRVQMMKRHHVQLDHRIHRR